MRWGSCAPGSASCRSRIAWRLLRGLGPGRVDCSTGKGSLKSLAQSTASNW